jgi:uncharacterized protein YdeI (YjbR/CyaY-like superfamily)
MDKLFTLAFVDRNQWRRWLQANHGRQREVWVVLPKKNSSGTSFRVCYNQALEEAICFGWIDSRIRSLDETKSMIRFTPRKSSNWSRPNLAKARDLIRTGKMTQAGLKTLPGKMKPSGA